jgi:molybdopterin-guanine dinucleotide biosynthesis protein
MFSDDRFIIIAGTGRNVGKTTLACHLIQHLSSLHRKVIGLKFITLKEEKDGFVHKHHQDIETFKIIKEDHLELEKDTAKMLRSGAFESFLIVSKPAYVLEALSKFIFDIKDADYIVAESANLRHYFKPKTFVIVDREDVKDRKSYIDALLPFADLIVNNALDKNIAQKVLKV